MFSFDNFIKYLPEFFILLSAVLCTYFPKFYKRITFIGLGVSLAALTFQEVVVYSAYMLLLKILLLISAIFVLLLRTKRVFMSNRFNSLVLFSIFFLMMLMNSNNYLAMYMNIEFYSICLYFLISYDKTSFAEMFKYFVTSTFSSLIMLLGVGLLYGITGSVDFTYIEQYSQLNNNYSMSTYILPYLLIFSGLFFKLGLFPFANWLLDFYRGVDTKIITYVSVIPKLGVVGVLINILRQCVSFETSLILILLALFSGLFGVFFGFRAKNIMSIMACSSYVNLSYIMVALALYTRFSVSTVLFYLLTYIFMNIGVLAGIMSIKYYDGFFYQKPLFGAAFLVCIVSLLGFPISSGFISKIYLLSSVLNSGLVVLPVILVMLVLMTSSFIFYIRPINSIFRQKDIKRVVPISLTNKLVLYSCAFMTFVLGLFPTYAIKLCEVIASYL